MKKIYFLLCFALLSLFFVSCKDDNPAETTQTENEKIINQLKFFTDSLMENTEMSGICAVVIDHKKGLNWSYAAGFASIPDKQPLSLENTFRIGSVTKTMVATVALQLIDEGKLSLTDKLSKFFPQYPKADSVTILMLLNMRSGIFSYTSDSLFNHLVFGGGNPTKVWTPQELVDLSFNHPYDFSPGTSYYYCNTNYIILGLIIEQITGNQLDAELNTRIFQKLQLTNTGLLNSGLTFPGNNAKGYYYGDYIENDDHTNRYDISWAWAAGSAYSTPLELVKYVEALVKGGLLSEAMQEKRLSEHFTAEDDIISYGLGIKRFGSFYGHTGALPGYQTNIWHSKEKDATIVICFNCTLYPNNPFTALTVNFIKTMYGEDYSY